MQNLCELEEVISYAQNLDWRDQLQSGWQKRISSAAPVPKQLLVNLSLHALVRPVHEDIPTWISFIDIARQKNRPRMAECALARLLSEVPTPNTSPLQLKFDPASCDVSIAMTYFKHLKNIGELPSAFEKLSLFVSTFSQRTDIDSSAKAICHLTLGEWKQRLEDITSPSGGIVSDFVMENLKIAKDFDDQNFRAWHSWAMANLHTALSSSPWGESSPTGFGETQLAYLVSALKGFFRSVQLSTSQASSAKGVQNQDIKLPVTGDSEDDTSALVRDTDLQDLLRILFIWFNFGHYTAVYR